MYTKEYTVYIKENINKSIKERIQQWLNVKC